MIAEERLSQINDELIKLKSKRDELVRRQYQILNNKLHELRPIIDFVKKHRFYFKHPDESIRFQYANGPILMYNQGKEEVYVYDTEANKVLALSNYGGGEKRDYNLYSFVERFGIDEAMKSLEYLAEMPEKLIESLNIECATREQSIEKYESN